MADLEKHVAYIFSGVDRLSDPLKKIENGFSGLNDKLNTATQPLASFASGIEKIDLALTALAVGGLAFAYSKSIAFESASIDLEKVLGSQKDRIAEAEQAALDLSNAYGVSSTEVLQSAANFKQAGFDYDESIQLVKNSLDLKIAGDLEAAQSSEILVAALKGFAAPASEAGRLVDVLNGVSNEYATNVEELGKGMAALSPIASTMGFSFEETAGILTPVIEIFRSGDEAAMALKTGLLKLVDDAKPVRTALESLGVSQTDYNGNLRSGKDILLDVQKAFQGLSDNEKLYYTQQLVGIEQSARMVAVFDNFAKTSEVTATALKSVGSAQEEVDLRLASGEVAVSRFLVNFENMAIKIGSEFRDAATSAISGATEIEKAISFAVGAGTFDEMFEAIEDFANSLGVKLREIASVAPEAFEKIDWSGLLDSFGDLGEEIRKLFSAFFGDIDLTTAAGLAEALQLIVNGFEKLVDVTSGIVASFGPAAKYLGEWARGAADAESGTAKLVGQISGFGQQINAITGALPVFGAALSVFAGSSMINAIANVGTLATTMAAIAGPIGVVAGAAAGLGLAIGAVSGPVDVLNEGLSGFEDELSGVSAGMSKASESADVLRFRIDETGKVIQKIPEEVTLSMTAEESEDFKRIMALFDQDRIADQKMNVSVVMDANGFDETISKIHDVDGKEINLLADTSQAETRLGAAMSLMNDIPREYSTDYAVVTNEASIAGAKKKVEAELPKEKELELRLKGEIEKELAMIKANADTLQTAMEWTAKVKISQFETDMERVKAIMSNTSEVITGMGDAISGMFSDIPTDLRAFQEWLAALDQQLDIQQETHELNKRVIEQQMEIMRLKEQRLKSGKALIEIETSGLEPHLEEIMWSIIEKVQVRATEEATEFLLGM